MIYALEAAFEQAQSVSMAEAAADESLRARLFSVQGQQFLLPAFARFETLDTRPSITIVLRDSGFEQRCPLTPYVTPAPAAPRLEPEQRQELPQLAEPDAGSSLRVAEHRLAAFVGSAAAYDLMQACYFQVFRLGL